MDVLGYFGLSSILSSNYVASSLNLFFFYLTWATLVLSQPPLRLELVGSFVIRIIFYWIPTFLFTVFDGLMPGLSNDLKVRRGRPVPWRDALLITTNGVINQLIATAIQGLVHVIHAQMLMRKSPAF